MSGRFDKIKDISVIGSGDIIGSVISAGFWFYLASIIDVDNYGEINYFISIAQTASAIALLGTTSTLIVYSAKNIKIHATLYLLSLSVGVISAIVVYFLADNVETGILVLGYIIFGLVIAITLAFKPMLAKYLAPIYAVVEGIFLGLVSIFCLSLVIITSIDLS